ncbi:MAG TPA: sigma-70 family RNA polymerase sigma factor [Vicinamibacterales bacterium]|nr:sigma-70 family RNA polymerase sigma factor [Vicinamibacterales bacterium]
MTPEQEHELALLMQASQRGDSAAYEALLQSLGRVVSLYVRRRIGTAHWADDVVQDALASIHLSRHTWNPARPFAPWFYAVVNSRLIDAIRRQHRTSKWETPTDKIPTVASNAGPEAGLVARVDLTHALGSLSPAQRLVIERLRLDELSVKDVARETGMSESNVKVIAHRGYAALRRLLSGMGYGGQ